ncbi:MAG: hypothetical protein AB7P03_14490 [Kofleriaceae bacterium]
MTRFVLVGSFILVVTLVAFVPSAIGGDPCKRASFDTKLVGDACKVGGTPAAKDAMKKWVKQAKRKQAGLECASCHSKMAPTYDLKPDGLALFRKLGGQ